MWRLFAFKENKLTLKVRRGVFPKIVIIKFDVYPQFLII